MKLKIKTLLCEKEKLQSENSILRKQANEVATNIKL
jgi:hypothetical protein